MVYSKSLFICCRNLQECW